MTHSRVHREVYRHSISIRLLRATSPVQSLQGRNNNLFEREKKGKRSIQKNVSCMMLLIYNIICDILTYPGTLNAPSEMTCGKTFKK